MAGKELAFVVVQLRLLLLEVLDLNFINISYVFDVSVLRWRICFWVSTFPAAILALAMLVCAESPNWLYKVFSSYLFRSISLHLNSSHV